MTPTDGAGLIELWLLQIVWGLGPWICIGFGLVVITRGSGVFKSAARNIEQRAERTSAHGRAAISFDLLSHRIVTILSMLFAFACIGVAGMVSEVLQGGVEARVRELPPAIEAAPGQTASVDFIAAVCLATLGVTLAITVCIYRALRQRALEHSATPDLGAHAPAMVRFFSRPPLARLGVTAFSAFLFFGFLSQIAWGLMLVYPPPASWLTLEAPGLLPALGWILLWIGPAVLLAALSPTWNLTARYAQLHQRFFKLNPQMRRNAGRRAAIGVGFIGAVIDFNLLIWIGARLFPEAF
jgi:hypothetical protein